MKSAAILTAAKTLFDADTTLPRLVPGGLWQERGRQGTASPYAIAKVTPGEKRLNSGTSYLQLYTLTIRVYSSAGPVDAGGIAASLSALYDRNVSGLVIAGATISAENIVRHVEPRQGSLEKDPARDDQKDVEVTTGAWEVMLEITLPR